MGRQGIGQEIILHVPPPRPRQRPRHQLMKVLFIKLTGKYRYKRYVKDRCKIYVKIDVKYRYTRYVKIDVKGASLVAVMYDE